MQLAVATLCTARLTRMFFKPQLRCIMLQERPALVVQPCVGRAQMRVL